MTHHTIDNGQFELFGIYFNGPKALDRLNAEYPEIPRVGKGDNAHCQHCGMDTFYGAILLAFDGTDEDSALLGFVTIAEECAKNAFPASVDQFAKLKNFGRKHRRASVRPAGGSVAPVAAAPSQGTKPAPLGKNVTCEGVVLSVKEVIHTQYGPQNKMTVQCDGYRVYSTVPAAIASEVNLTTGKGKRVRFIAQSLVMGKDQDPFFAMVIRPKNAQVL